MKQYILVRTDKEFSRGKLMTHAAHASNIANEDCRQNHKERWEDWFLNLKMTKIVLAVNNEECLKKHHDLCVDLEIPVGMIPDAGYYETEAGTLICCAIGPITDEEYKLLKLKKWKLFR